MTNKIKIRKKILPPQINKQVNSYLGTSPSRIDSRVKLSGADEWVATGKWARVKSTNVRYIKYDKKEKILSVQFKNGMVYPYKQVPVRTAKDMYNASSMGRYVWRRLRDVYSFD